MRSLTFCRKFNFEQLLVEALFLIIGNFGSVQPQSEFFHFSAL